ncbi:hypothetical protein ACFQI7_09010 [Paenibacillus allorhizosphaerae]|uniref:Uncharacterized protein n=1 Tax=Paenibacillus allorhizosphaerae TaxID=2849866 RepID=A0ABM8VIA3_9BACL|nr:hypothetical protein [Paenibacillus allorhizosphaerae]CAG7643927.1 hypothetical protein PAECIP111802_03113 [Paenibacillus allorhizosphaerae]
MIMTSVNFDALSKILQNTLSMEVRVENSEVADLMRIMDELGFKLKNSWASMQIPDNTVFDFWRKELVKS